MALPLLREKKEVKVPMASVCQKAIEAQAKGENRMKEPTSEELIESCPLLQFLLGKCEWGEQEEKHITLYVVSRAGTNLSVESCGAVEKEFTYVMDDSNREILLWTDRVIAKDKIAQFGISTSYRGALKLFLQEQHHQIAVAELKISTCRDQINWARKKCLPPGEENGEG